jgi:hypothetical protein
MPVLAASEWQAKPPFPVPAGKRVNCGARFANEDGGRWFCSLFIKIMTIETLF